jgi:hypothetical protein
MSNQHYPTGWNEARVQRLIDHYENMSDDQMIAEDEAAHRAGTDKLPGPGARPKTNGRIRAKGSRRPKRGKPARTKPRPKVHPSKKATAKRRRAGARTGPKS